MADILTFPTRYPLNTDSELSVWRFVASSPTGSTFRKSGACRQIVNASSNGYLMHLSDTHGQTKGGHGFLLMHPAFNQVEQLAALAEQVSHSPRDADNASLSLFCPSGTSDPQHRPPHFGNDCADFGEGTQFIHIGYAWSHQINDLPPFYSVAFIPTVDGMRMGATPLLLIDRPLHKDGEAWEIEPPEESSNDNLRNS